LKESSDGKTLVAVGMIPDLWSSRGESTTSKTGYYAGSGTPPK